MAAEVVGGINDGVTASENDDGLASTPPDIANAGGAEADSDKQQRQKRTAKNPHLFGKCQVCGLVANGVHYGVESCEGCKVCLIIYYRYSSRIRL